MRDTCKLFLIFTLVGALSTAVHFAALFILTELFSLYAVWSSTLGYLAGGVVNYTLNYHSTFRSNVPHSIALSRFIAVAVIGGVANGLLMQLMITSFGLHYLIGQAIATLAVLIWNFSANRYWTFGASKLIDCGKGRNSSYRNPSAS